MKVFDKNLKAHKTTNTLYLVIIIPFLLLAILSVTIMINAKNAGGYANIFGYYVVELKDDSLYNAETGEYKSGTKQMFKATSADDIKAGDVVAYYSATPPKTINGDNWDWVTLSNNVSLTETTYDSTTEDPSQVSVVKIGPKKVIFTIDNQTYTGFSYYKTTGELMMNEKDFILADDIIGVAVPSSAVLATAIDFGKTVESLLLFVLLPCMILLLIKFISLAFYRKYENANQVTRKGQIIDNEQTSQGQGVYSATMHAPQRPTRVSAVRQAPTPRTPPSRPPRPPQRPTKSE